ncbi:MAG: hypothetical protein V1709_10970 [Planctomycetota bacterium]
MRTLDKEKFTLLRRDRWNIETRPTRSRRNVWTFVEIGTDAAPSSALRFRINNPVIEQHVGGFGISISNTIEQEIKEARASLRDGNFSNYKDVFGK